MPVMFIRPATHDEGAPALQLDGVTVRFDGVVALDTVSLRIERGDRVAVVGPNGAGKSTLFNVIAGIVKPCRGRVDIYGSGPSDHICVGYVPQRNRIDWRFPATVRDVVMMGRVGRMGLFRWPSRRDQNRVSEALERVGMVDLSHRQIGELSGGQQQRVFLARALAQEAELLLLDEPLSGLDLPSQDAITSILGELNGRGITVLVATHDLGQAAEDYPKMIVINRRIIAYGDPESVLTADVLASVYGSQLHVVHGPDGDRFFTDSCCGGGHPPVHPLLGPYASENELLSPAPDALAQEEQQP